MTSEICMMNRLGVVLAADSATTVSRWVDGKREERYFKGANKVFQLSDMQPIGLMIFDSADILNVPWELIIKSFRAYISDRKFDTVDDYAKALFLFLSDNPRFFPIDIQNEAIIDAARHFAMIMISEAIKDTAVTDRGNAIEADFASLKAAIYQNPLPECIGEADLAKAIAELLPHLETDIEEFLKVLEIGEFEHSNMIAEISLQEVIKNSQHHLDTTGLVFAGFGEHEIFPAMIEYQSRGMVAGKHLYTRRKTELIDHRQPAYMEGFAQTSMIDTFNAGVSFEVYTSIMMDLDQSLKEFAEEISARSGGKIDAIVDLDDLVQTTRKKIGDRIIDKARKEHSLPLRSVLSVLPANEMAELAETLITLQSLKEKVTKPSETVGGPVDVAIITKSEGLVWVRRKHFFNPELNSRFHLRLAAQHQ